MCGMALSYVSVLGFSFAVMRDASRTANAQRSSQNTKINNNPKAEEPQSKTQANST
jgi:hypothetical protein